jgi:hypothetical protein
MEITLKLINKNNTTALKQLFQFAFYDMSGMINIDVNINGDYPQLPDMEEYSNKENYKSYPK